MKKEKMKYYVTDCCEVDVLYERYSDDFFVMYELCRDCGECFTPIEYKENK